MKKILKTSYDIDAWMDGDPTDVEVIQETIYGREYRFRWARWLWLPFGYKRQAYLNTQADEESR